MLGNSCWTWAARTKGCLLLLSVYSLAILTEDRPGLLMSTRSTCQLPCSTCLGVEVLGFRV